MKWGVAVLLLASAFLSAPANAGKYICNFQKDGNILKECRIDSTTDGNTCDFNFAKDLIGACGAANLSAKQDYMLCGFFTPAGSIKSVLRESAAQSTNLGRALAQKPGFVAGAVTIAAPNSAIFASVYVEKQGEPSLAGVCVPQ